MTVQQLLKHFNNRSLDVAYAIGYTEPAIRHWIKKGKIPYKAQRIIEMITEGKLVARREKKNEV